MSNNRQHEHLIFRARVVNVINNRELLDEWVLGVVRAAGMNVISGPHSVYSDVKGHEGWTSIAVLDLSHIAVHFWNNDDLMEFDLFSCKSIPTDKVLEEIQKLGIKKIEIYKWMDRDAMAARSVRSVSDDV